MTRVHSRPDTLPPPAMSTTAALQVEALRTGIPQLPPPPPCITPSAWCFFDRYLPFLYAEGHPSFAALCRFREAYLPTIAAAEGCAGAPPSLLAAAALVAGARTLALAPEWPQVRPACSFKLALWGLRLRLAARTQPLARSLAPERLVSWTQCGVAPVPLVGVRAGALALRLAAGGAAASSAPIHRWAAAHWRQALTQGLQHQPAALTCRLSPARPACHSSPPRTAPAPARGPPPSTPSPSARAPPAASRDSRRRRTSARLRKGSTACCAWTSGRARSRQT